MWQQCVAVTAALALAAVAARAMADGSEASQTGRRLVEHGVHWVSVAREEPDALLRLQHAATALAYLRAAREVCADAELTRTTGVDVERAWAHAERRLAAARQSARGAPNAR